MDLKETKQAIEAHFNQGTRLERWCGSFRRLWWYTVQLGHSLVDVPRETLRALGAPDAPGDARNWADNLARTVAIALVILVLWGIRALVSVPPPMFVP